VEKHEDVWMVVLNEDGMPDLRISRYYQKVMRDASKSDKDYLLDKLRGAEFLIKSINKRRKTIRRVMDSILKFQSEFFDAGVSRLRPLVLQEVADDVGVHMSTVSRVTTNKYVHTPHGTFELKYFFSAGVRQQSGGDMASEAIRNKIKLIVAAENPKKPLSDQAIANALKKEGIRIARRTVAKYREQLGILPSSRRKMMF
jgi:RNA polymerase sigma-54 factor